MNNILNIYLIERTDEIGYDEVISMVIVAETPKDAVDTALAQDWGDWNKYKERKYLVAKEVDMTLPQVVHIATKDG